MLSNQSKYAIRGVLFLALHSCEVNKLSVRDISEQTGIPSSFLAKIFQKLTKKGIIHSTKGPKGGFYMSKEEKDKSLLEIVECIDNMKTFHSCFLGLSDCSDNNPCVIHHVAALRRRGLLEELQTKSIAELAEEANCGCYRIS